MAAAALMFAGFALTPFRPSKFGDRNFHVEAKRLSAAIRGAVPMADFRISKAPGPVFYFTVPYLFVAPGSPEEDFWRAAVLWSAICVCLAMVLLRRTGEEIGGPRLGWIALALALFPPFVVYYSFGILSEPPAFIAAVLIGYGWVRWLKRRERPVLTWSWWLTWGGVAFLLLCRPNALFLVVAAALCALGFLRSREAIRRSAAIFILSGLAVPLATTLGSVLLVRALGGGWQERNLAHVVMQSRFQFRDEPWDWRYWQKRYREGSRDHAAFLATEERLMKQAGGSDKAFVDLEWDWIRKDVASHPFLSLRMIAVRALALNLVWANNNPDFSLNAARRNPVSVGFHLVLNLIYNGVLVLAILYLLKNRRAIPWTWALWAPWLALFLFHVLTYVEPRYLIPGRPGIAVLAALMLERLIAPARKPVWETSPAEALAGSFPKSTKSHITRPPSGRSAAW